MKSKNKVRKSVPALTEIKAHKIIEMNELNVIHDLNGYIDININVTICIHCYDINIFKEIMLYIRNFFEFKWKHIQFIVHHIKHSQTEIEEIIKTVLKDVDKDIIVESCGDSGSGEEEIGGGSGDSGGVLDYFKFIEGENIGVDIGGFMRCLDEVREDDDIVVKIHTKTDDIWRRSMMNIFSVNGIYTSMKLLESNNIGMIGSIYNIEHFRKKFNPEFRINQYYIPMIQNICNLINLPFNESNVIQSYFVAGTIFICKKSLLNEIIKERKSIYNLCLDLRKTKWVSGKMKFTYEHASEILFGYIPFQFKQLLVGIY